MQSYSAEIAYSRPVDRGAEHSITIQFLAPSRLDAALSCGKWFENRHNAVPEIFGKLLCIKVYLLNLQTFRPDGYLPSDNGGCFYEYKCDTAGLPYERHVRCRLEARKL